MSATVPEELSERSRVVRAGEAVAEATMVGLVAAISPELAVLATSFSAARANGLFAGWLRTVDHELHQTGAILDAGDPRTQAAFTTLTQGALQTSRSEKWTLLAAALLNSSAFRTESDFMVEHFASLVVRFSPEHVRLLQVLAWPKDARIDTSRLSNEALLDALCRDASAEQQMDMSFILDVARGELEYNNLIGTNFVTSYQRGLADDDDGGSHVEVTGIGRRFLAYLDVKATEVASP